jgi:lipopolysaccharide/colanic/teichoic acid biosynthesis glycosyltransferase
MSRVLNLVAASIGMLATAPLWLVLPALIRLEDGGPVFYRQERVGRDGKIFRLFKFRSMVVDAEHRELGLNVESGDSRITRTGRFLRRWSLDELPQLLNVFAGDMNVIGPRPALPFQVAKYTAEQKRRLLVRPGLTGWAQVNGRNALTWKEKIAADLWYVDHRSVLLDLWILARTPLAVISTEGLYETDAGVDDEFNVPDGDPES